MRFDFTRTEYEFFLQECGFTDEEEKILSLKRRGYTHMEIANELHYCERTIKSRIKSIKQKIIKSI